MYLVAAGTGVNRGGTKKYLYTRMAVRGSMRFLEIAHREDGLRFNHDIEWRRAYLSPAVLETFWVVGRFLKRSREQLKLPVAYSVRAPYFLECTGWWPPGDTTPEESVPEWALNRVVCDRRCRAGEQLQEVGGRQCLRLEIPGQDRIWLDVDRGLAVVRRERKVGSLFWVYENSDFREMAPGIWLPWRLYRLGHRGPAPGKVLNQRDVLVESTQVVSYMEINRVSDDFFVFRPPPGTLVYDQDRGRTWQVPGGIETLDEVIAVARRRMRVARPRCGQPCAGVAAAGCIALFAALALISAAILRARWRLAAAGLGS